MKTKLILGALTAAMLMMYSCTDPDKIRVEDVKMQNIKLLSPLVINADVGLKVINGSGHKAAIIGVRAEFRMDGVSVAEVTLRDKIVAPKRSENVYTLPSTLRLNGLMALTLLGNLDAKAFERCTVSARITLRSGWVKKSLNIDNMPLTALLRQLGQDPEDFLNNNNFDW